MIMNMKKILYAGSEVMPFAATGGLGDVLGSLPAAVKQKNPECDVRVVMPYYGQIKAEWRKKMTYVKHMMVPLAWRKLYCGIYSLEKDGVTYYFLDNEYYFRRSSLYGCFDDAERFAFFSVAVLELMSAVDFYPDIFHHVHVVDALIFDIVNGVYGTNAVIFGNEGITSLELDHGKGCLPVVCVEDVGIEINRAHQLKNGNGKERKSFRIVEATVQTASSEIIFVVKEIIGYSVFFQRINTAIKLTPSKRNHHVLHISHLFAPFRLDLTVIRHNNANVAFGIFLFYSCGKRTENVTQSASCRKGHNLATCIQYLFHIHI